MQLQHASPFGLSVDDSASCGVRRHRHSSSSSSSVAVAAAVEAEAEAAATTAAVVPK